MGPQSDRTPASPHPRVNTHARVLANTPLCREHFRLDLLVDQFPVTSPGQFVQLLCREPVDDVEDEAIDWQMGKPIAFRDGDLLAAQTMLARPFSLAGRTDRPDGVCLSIIHRVVGVGTAWLASLTPGDSVHLLGPLGNRFSLPKPGETAILIGGGVGIPPMLYLADALRSSPAIAFCGATTRDLLPLRMIDDAADPADSAEPSMRIAEFADCGIPTVITTDDGSYGSRGFVTQALEQHLNRFSDDPAFHPTLFTCGPEPMMKRVAQIAIDRNIPCQVAVERSMACGMGTCQSCVIKVKTGTGDRYRLSCTDGPIFPADQLVW